MYVYVCMYICIYILICSLFNELAISETVSGERKYIPFDYTYSQSVSQSEHSWSIAEQSRVSQKKSNLQWGKKPNPSNKTTNFEKKKG